MAFSSHVTSCKHVADALEQRGFSSLLHSKQQHFVLGLRRNQSCSLAKRSSPQRFVLHWPAARTLLMHCCHAPCNRLNMPLGPQLSGFVLLMRSLPSVQTKLHLT
jgi:hypothetical protein